MGGVAISQSEVVDLVQVFRDRPIPTQDKKNVPPTIIAENSH